MHLEIRVGEKREKKNVGGVMRVSIFLSLLPPNV